MQDARSFDANRFAEGEGLDLLAIPQSDEVDARFRQS